MQFEKISAPSLKDLFVQQLENMILSGKLKVGTQLPPERELAESMQVSRAVVNAGIGELAAKGFLEVHPRVGTVVSDYRKTGTADTLLSIMKYNGGRLRRQEVQSIIEIKLVLEKLAVQLAVPKLTEHELSLLGEKLEAMREAEESQQAAEAAFHFYHELMLLSGNTLLPLMYNSFRVLIINLWAIYDERMGPKTLFHSASALYDTLCRKDTEAAVRSLEKTLGEALREAERVYSTGE